ncbi:P-loop containing nucleoside triphosphate hydrolase protein [Tothia fuscella]|uniref:DNA 3'-5' helicase n=1 Tax=Tothia fuscella TaxID=1048955 RepID=A0A9P4NLN9_9PEZI|nr:P-loop containing nucleoside triphosphate hydrolase protein [Tothia fuscella]
MSDDVYNLLDEINQTARGAQCPANHDVSHDDHASFAESQYYVPQLVRRVEELDDREPVQYEEGYEDGYAEQMPSHHHSKYPRYDTGYDHGRSQPAAPRHRLTFPSNPGRSNASQTFAPPEATHVPQPTRSTSPVMPSSPSLRASQRKTEYQGLRQNALPLRLVNGIELRSTHELPDRFRSVFKFPNFNAVQSKCFPTVYGTNDNFVLSSPTGSGKTAIFELAILRLINGFANGTYKIVYQAPTKSLCAERQRDWERKFKQFDLECAELTGDTETNQLRKVQQATIIITTPEKWDSMTRRWKDHAKLVQLVKLFLIDEVHMLKDDRGPTLEAVVSRMKSIGSDVRFIALSATVPNSDDIATWLGKNPMNQNLPAQRERFGEEFRPVVLQRHVVGYQTQSNDFAFEKTLDSKLPEVISKYSHRKPIMVFCATRSAALATARTLANWWSTKSPKERYWEAPRKQTIVSDKDLKECVSSAVAFHHARLSLDDRAAVENGFLNGDINVICCTSTLAVGVNLPCHFVIIKNTMGYTNEGLKEYSDLVLMQMLGRAGRPQFDTSAVAVIMTRQEKVKRYTAMVSGQAILESCLHRNLIEHMNAEIGLGTINNLSSAKKWLSSTFLYVRMRDNPEHYHLVSDNDGSKLEERLESICVRELALLREHSLIKGEESFSSTEFGEAVARYCVRFETAKLLLGLPPKAKPSEILAALAQAVEFKDLRFTGVDKTVYKELNKSPSIRFPIPVNLDLPAHKVSLIIQSQLGGVDFPVDERQNATVGFQYAIDTSLVFQHVNRLIRCAVDILLCFDDSISLRNALMLCRSLGARCWDDSPLQLKQLEKIGIAAVRRLVNANIRSIEALESTDAQRIETILNRAPPFGLKVLDIAKAFPKLRVSMQVVGQPILKAGHSAKVNVKANIGFMNDKPPQLYQGKLVYVIFLAETSDGIKVQFARINAKALNKGQEIKFQVNLTSPTQSIISHVMCDELAGTLRSATLKPTIPSMAWPTLPSTEGQATTSETRLRPSMNTSRRLTARPEGHFGRTPSDEFGSDGLDDGDLLRAAAGSDDLEFGHIDNYGNQTTMQTKKNTAKNKKQKLTEPIDESWQPEKLASGKWMCNHKCKDKTVCKHMCCREGLDNPPKVPKKPATNNEKTEGPANSTQQQIKLQKGQTTLSMTAMKKGKSGSAAEVAQLDLTHVSAKPNKVRGIPACLEKLERLHSATQHGLNVTVPTLARHRPSRSPLSASSRRLSFLPEPAHNGATETSEFGDSWPDVDDLPDIAMTNTLSKDKNRVLSPTSFDMDDSVGDNETRVPPVEDKPQDFGEADSMLEDAMVGLADSQDLLAVQDPAYQETDYEMDDFTTFTDIADVAIPPTPRKPKVKATNALPASEDDLPSLHQLVKPGPFIETSSPFFVASQPTKRSHLFKEWEGAGQRPSKKPKYGVVADMGMPLQSSVPVLSYKAPSPQPTAPAANSDVSSKPEGVDDWLIQEFGQYVNFV